MWGLGTRKGEQVLAEDDKERSLTFLSVPPSHQQYLWTFGQQINVGRCTHATVEDSMAAHIWRPVRSHHTHAPLPLVLETLCPQRALNPLQRPALPEAKTCKPPLVEHWETQSRDGARWPLPLGGRHSCAHPRACLVLGFECDGSAGDLASGRRSRRWT